VTQIFTIYFADHQKVVINITQQKRYSDPSFGSQSENEGRVRTVADFPWLAPVLSVPVNAMTLFIGRQKEIWHVKQELSSRWDGPPFGHNRDGLKCGGLLCPFRKGRGSSVPI